MCNFDEQLYVGGTCTVAIMCSSVAKMLPCLQLTITDEIAYGDTLCLAGRGRNRFYFRKSTREPDEHVNVGGAIHQ